MILEIICWTLFGAIFATIVVTVVSLTYAKLKQVVAEVFQRLKSEGKVDSFAKALSGVIEAIDTDHVDVHLFQGQKKVGELKVNYQSRSGIRRGMRVPVAC